MEESGVRNRYISSDEEDSGSRGHEVERITDEMVTMNGTHKYKVYWKNQGRSDASWLSERHLLPGAEIVLAEWGAKKRRRIMERRKRYSQTGVPISLFGGHGITKYNTILEELGLGANQRLTRDMSFPSPVNAKNGLSWDEEVEMAKAEAEPFLEEEATTTRSGSSMSTASSAHEIPAYPRHRSFKSGNEATSLPLTSSSSSRAGSSHLSETKINKILRASRSPEKTKRPEIPKGGRHDSEEHAQREARKQTPQKSTNHGHRYSTSTPAKRPSTTSIEPSPSKRQNTGKARERITERTILQDKWDRAIEQAGAAPLTIVNEVDEELVPSSVDLKTFEYLESGPYKWNGPTHDGFFVGCDGDCYDPRQCECQSAEFAEEIMISGKRRFAYDSAGRYMLPDNSRVAVFECNAACSCDITCLNRVSQRPRDVPMEVFRAKGKGWGVRATQFIPKGKVLGLFTGALIPSTIDDGWCYALDWFEENFKWRVSSKHCGNWSRFLNHSCYPNIKVYAVIFDSVPDAGEDHRHRLAFVAIKDIEPRTELVIDYTPQTPHGTGENCCSFGGCAPN